MKEDGTVDIGAETYSAGQPVLFQGKVSISEQGRTINAGTFSETEKGYIFDGTSFVYAENISPFTYVWEDGSGIGEVEATKAKAESATTAIYNLAGQRVGKPSKGLYIMSGRKVMIK